MLSRITCNSNININQLKYLKEEFCILVDKKDHAIGKASKFDCHKIHVEESKDNCNGMGLPLHRAFSVFLFHKNNLLLQQRSHHKVTWPLKWTNSCCSHPLMQNEKEEDLESAIMRKCKQELGVEPSNLKFIGKIIYKAEQDKWGEHELDHLFIGNLKSANVPFNSEEIERIRWINRNDMQSISKSSMTPWFSLIASKVNIFGMEPWNRTLDFTSE